MNFEWADNPTESWWNAADWHLTCDLVGGEDPELIGSMAGADERDRGCPLWRLPRWPIRLSLAGRSLRRTADGR